MCMSGKDELGVLLGSQIFEMFARVCIRHLRRKTEWYTQIICVSEWKEFITGALEPSGTFPGIAHLVISTTFGPGAPHRRNAPRGKALSERSMALMAHIRWWVYYIIVTEQVTKKSLHLIFSCNLNQSALAAKNSLVNLFSRISLLHKKHQV